MQVHPACAFFYFRGNGMGGLEGSYVCQAYAPEGMDLDELTERLESLGTTPHGAMPHGGDGR